ncbi:hypothetical protein ARSEF1564_003924 [Beauveria bassiana]
MGLFCDEDAPQFVPDDLMDEIGPSRAVDRLEKELEQMRLSLCERAARQKHRRDVEKLIKDNHFKRRNDEEL